MPESRQEQLTRFHAQHHQRLQSTVQARVNAPSHVIEDAIQTAWTKLIERPDITLDERGANWLTTVAIREGWHQATPRDTPAGPLTGPPEPGELPEPLSPTPSPDEHAIAHDTHHQRVADLQNLKPREQRDLLLHAAGYTYDDIAALTNSTWTAVNRRLTEGRAHLRRASGQRR